jgi:hypothetical protein
MVTERNCMDEHEYGLEVLKIQELERIRVLGEEVRKSVMLGFDRAMEMTRHFTLPQPPPAAPASISMPGDLEDDPLVAGILDVRSLNEMSPSARSQVLAAYGLQPLQPKPPEPDPTEANLNSHIAAEGHIPPGGKAKYEPDDDGGETD